MRPTLIFLTGLMGAGKSTLGALLARTLHWDFCDLDQEIVRREGRSIPEIFQEGERAFREAESRALLAVAARRECVIACGGGAVLCEENVRVMRERGLVVFLDRPVESILRDVEPSGRPLLAGGRERLWAIHERRDSLYRASAHVILKNDSTPEAGLSRLLEALRQIQETKP